MKSKFTDLNDHRRIVNELPWLVNGTLDKRAAISLHAHVAGCEVCKAEVASLTLMQESILNTPIPDADGAASLARMQQRIASEPTRSTENGLSRSLAWIRQLVSDHQMHSWVAVTVCGVILMVVLMPLSNWSVNQTDDSYRVLSSEKSSPDINLAVTFKEGLSEGEAKGILSTVTTKMEMQSNWRKTGPNRYYLSSLSSAGESSLSPESLMRLIDALAQEPSVKETNVMP